MTTFRALALVLALTCPPALADEPTPTGDDFQVNVHTVSYQQSPAIAVAPNGPGHTEGDFVVVWGSEGHPDDPGEGFEPVARLFTSADAPIGGEFLPNDFVPGTQSVVDVAVAAGRGGVFTWSGTASPGTDTSFGSVQARRFGAGGEAVGDSFQVNTYTLWNQSRSSVAIRPEGDFVIVWTSADTTDDDAWSGIRGQRFDSGGGSSGVEFQVNATTTLYQGHAQVAMAHDGSFAVVWQSNAGAGTDTEGYSVQVRRFAANGDALGDDLQVNESTASDQFEPVIAMAPSGAFVVAWTSPVSNGTDSDQLSIQARRFGADGSALGGEFQVNEWTTGSQRTPTVAMTRSRDFLVVWGSDGSPGDDDLSSIRARWFDWDGTALGDEFRVNAYTTDLQRSPDVAVAPNGDFVVVWESEGSSGTDDSSSSIQARRFAGRTFGDGFEDGDLTLWSSDLQ